MCVIINDSGLEEQGDPGQGPFGRLVLCLQIERPDVGGAPGARLVNRALVHVPHVLLVLGDGSDVDDRHRREKLLRPAVDDYARLDVPSCPFHENPVYVGPLARRRPSNSFFSPLFSI